MVTAGGSKEMADKYKISWHVTHRLFAQPHRHLPLPKFSCQKMLVPGKKAILLVQAKEANFLTRRQHVAKFLYVLLDGQVYLVDL